MTIEVLANMVIEKLKSIPDEAKQEGKESDFKCFWDEYKEQLQYQLYPNYDIFEENIKSLADEEIEKLSDAEIRIIFRTISSSYNPYKYNPVWEGPYENNYKPNFEDKRDHLSDSILSHIQNIAGKEVVKYNKPYINYIKYTVNELNIIAEVLEKLSPWEYSIRTYSLLGDSEGKQELAHLPNLIRYNGLERITVEEFERAMNSFLVKSRQIEYQTEISQFDITEQCNDNKRATPKREVESNNQTPLPSDKETPPASTGRDESGTAGNTKEEIHSELKSELHSEAAEKARAILKSWFAPSTDSQEIH